MTLRHQRGFERRDGVGDHANTAGPHVAKRSGVPFRAGEHQIHVARQLALELVDAAGLPAQALALPPWRRIGETVHDLRLDVVRVQDQPRDGLDPLDLRPGQRGVRVIEVDEVEPLRRQYLFEHRRKPAVPAIASGAAENEAHAFGEERIDGTHPFHDMDPALEHAIERLEVLAGARPGEDGGVECLVECAEHRQRSQRPARVRGQGHPGKQGEYAGALRRVGFVHSVPP